MSCKNFFRTNRNRVIIATTCSIIAMVLTTINLAVTSNGPRDSLSWAHYSYSFPMPICDSRGDPNCERPTYHDYDWWGNVGLIKSTKCRKLNDYEDIPEYNGCETVVSGSISDGNDLANAGRGVIAANVFGMLFSLVALIILWLYVSGKAAKLRVPRLILTIANFLALLLYIVSVSTWFKLALDPLPSQRATFSYTDWRGGAAQRSASITDVKTGYAVGVNIAVIFFEFVFWLFCAYRIWLPNKLEAGPSSPTSPSSAKSFNGGYNNYPSSSNLLQQGMNSPQGRAFGQAAATSFFNGPSTPGAVAQGGYGDGAASYTDSSTYGEGSTNGGYGNKNAYGY